MIAIKYISAVIVAAGNSTRMGLDKIFLPLNNIPVVAHSLFAFENSNLIDEIVIVCKPECKLNIINIMKKYSINKVTSFATGGVTRQESVFSGVRECNKNTTHFVIHDAARCLVNVTNINDVIYDSFVNKASALGVPVKDTLKIVNKKNMVLNTPDRSSLWITQTPQVIEKNLYLKAMNRAILKDLTFSDDCQLIENINHPVHIVRGSYSNLKLTTPEDITIFEELLKLKNKKEKNL